jgi:dihydroxyacetone kinase-like predicted kinase
MAVSDGQRNASYQETKLMENLEQEKEQFFKDLQELGKSFQVVQRFDNYSKVKVHADEVMSLVDRFDKGQERVKSFNEREVLFK